MFKDRKDAGKKLAHALKEYCSQDVLVLAIPKGAVRVAYEVAKFLKARFSMLIARKLPFLDDPESGFGAIAEDGSTFMFEDARHMLSPDDIDRIKRAQLEEIRRRIKILRGAKPLPEIQNQVVILVDDGLARGSTMRSAIMLCRKRHARKIVVAVPVAGQEVAAEIGYLADQVIVLEKPEFFQAVAQVYENWYDVPDEEVLAIMSEWQKNHGRIANKR